MSYAVHMQMALCAWKKRFSYNFGYETELFGNHPDIGRGVIV